ncbi:hypothetical protein CRE_21405 [Caenorhabditis remanei]|uniref:Uncharacterized protein n=1 Tax=Caenorhabditis remanei TaxID=31234 RepID=E3MUS0_CAERE|nr:hypothetical protein CRE_21405 [Caenorhabditis remanei]
MSRPLSYLSLKCVILFLEPHSRFKVIASIPSLKFADLAIPFHIHNLDLEQSKFKINQAEFKFDMVKIFNKDKTRYNEYFQLTINEITHEYLTAQESIEKAMWYLAKKLFRDNMIVTNLSLRSEGEMRLTWLPFDLKLKAHQLFVGQGASLIQAMQLTRDCDPTIQRV